MTEATHTHHGPSYYLIFGILAVLTLVTVGVSYINFENIGGSVSSITVALFIATIKASLVALYFMHLRYEVKSLYFVIGFPLLLLVIMFLALLWEF